MKPHDPYKNIIEKKKKICMSKPNKNNTFCKYDTEYEIWLC